MIIENGTIEEKIKIGGGIDPDTGYPIKPKRIQWGTPIPCQYVANRHDNLGRVNGEHFKIASYSILIEDRPLIGEQIRLKDHKGNVIGEFSIIQIEALDAVCQIRISV